MNRKILVIIFALAVTVGVAGSTARAQTPETVPSGSQTTCQAGKAGATQSTAGEQTFSREDQALAAKSKKAIIETGISESYFDKHFRLTKIVNEAGDRRVEWKYSINEYETSLIDDIGYYTTPANERVDVHSIKNELFSAYDINRTIPRSKADAALKSCLGEYRDVTVVYRALQAPGKARLYLTARAKTVLDSQDEKDQKPEKETEREIEGISFNVGFVDLENGKCTITRGQITP